MALKKFHNVGVMIKYRKEDSTSYALGTTLVIELLKRRKERAVRLYISPKQNKDSTYETLLSLAKEAKIPVIQNNEKIFKDLSGKDNCMAICEFKKITETLEENENHVCLVNPSNLGNLGTIIRCMAGFHFLSLAIIRPACEVFDPKTVRASMGALFDVKVALYDSFEDYRKEFPNHALYPFMLQAKTPLKKANKRYPATLIMGNEATGLPRDFLNVGTPLLIPHTDFIDSLNLDNATAIALYEFAAETF